MKKLFLTFILYVTFTLVATQPTFAAPFQIETNKDTGCNVFIGGYTALSIGCFSQIVINLISLGFMFLGGVAMIFFLMGAFKFVTSGGDSKALDSGRNMMIYSVIGAAFVISSFVIIGVITGTLSFLPIDTSTFTLYQK